MPPPPGGHPLATMRRFGESQAAPTDAPKPATPEVGNCLQNGVMPFGITSRQETGTGHGHPGLGGTSGPARHGWARRTMEGLALSHDGRESVVRRTVVAMVLAALVCVSCTSTPTTSPKSTGSSSTTTTISSTTTTSRPPSALDNLTTYFATAERVDQRLKAAAIVVNGDIGATQLTVDQSTTDAISTADPEPVKRFETLLIHEFCATSSRATGGLIHATSGSCGAAGGRCRNRMGLAA